MEEKKELSKVILDTCDKELDGSIGFMLTEREADIFATTILSAGYIKKSEIECDEEMIKKIIIEMAKKEYVKDKKTIHLIFDTQAMKDLAHAIATHLKDIIK